MKKSITLIIILLWSISSYAQNDSIQYSFFVAGHTYGHPGVNNIGFHPPFKQKFDYIQSRPEIKFGVLTGDIVSPNPDAQDWDEIDADIATLGLPVYFAVGNHDMENRPLFESRYGKTYYHFIYQNDLFIVLDPNIDGWNISGEQLKFLKNILKTNAATTENIYVFFHQILWKGNNQFGYISWNSPAGRDPIINFWTEVHPLFHSLPNEVIMFAGDVGASWASDVTYDHYDNITLICTGMGAQDGENFVVVNVKSDKSIDYDVICLSDSINCLGELTDYLVVSELDGEEANSDNNYKSTLFPNPATDFITFSHNAKKVNTTIQLFNIQGKLILEEKFSNQYKHTIDVRHLPQGIYIAKISNDLIQSTIKVLIQ